MNVMQFKIDNKLELLRNRAGLTQRRLAIALDVTVTTISNWERGKRELKLAPKDMLRLCRILNCTLEELAGE